VIQATAKCPVQHYGVLRTPGPIREEQLQVANDSETQDYKISCRLLVVTTVSEIRKALVQVVGVLSWIVNDGSSL